MVTSFDEEAECILTNWTMRRRGVPPYKEYFKWKDLLDSETSWERAKDLWQFEHLIHHYHDEEG
uniref:Chromo domain-containing protein n=1 Tax=Nelumbo nucifera TaxID=4432 RepID=A0A822XPE7_NELNU|nr:TPA_asm: hypothetical protein HUJ06_024947 [Nelumbo nucifera]